MLETDWICLIIRYAKAYYNMWYCIIFWGEGKPTVHRFFLPNVELLLSIPVYFLWPWNLASLDFVEVAQNLWSVLVCPLLIYTWLNVRKSHLVQLYKLYKCESKSVVRQFIFWRLNLLKFAMEKLELKKAMPKSPSVLPITEVHKSHSHHSSSFISWFETTNSKRGLLRMTHLAA